MLLAFYIFATVAVVSALGVLLCRNPIYSAMSLVVTFFSLGGIYILMNAEFVAVIQILVYAGAILVLFLFVIMLLNVRPQDKGEKLTPQKIITGLVGGAVTIGLLAQIIGLFQSDLQYGPKDVYTVEAVTAEGSIGVIGRLLYGEYVLPFEVISILLLVAVIGAVLIAKRRLH